MQIWRFALKRANKKGKICKNKACKGKMFGDLEKA